MEIILFLFLLLAIVIGIKYKSSPRLLKTGKSNTLERFKRQFKGKSKLKIKFAETFSDILMSDPNKDIKLGRWDTEQELREKADIHKARLYKYGQSRINGELLFMDKEKKVFKISKSGNKDYI